MVTTPAPPAAESLPDPEGGNRTRPSMVEAIMDNLSFWTVISAAIGLLYLIWATLEILNRYVGHVPSVLP
jgi:hypothetical protein